MTIYIISRDFSETLKAECFEWDYYNDNRHNSSFKVFGEISGYEGGVVAIYRPPSGRGHFSLIDTMTPDNGVTTIKTKPIIEIFDRDIEWTRDMYYYLDGAYDHLRLILFDAIWNNWRGGQADEACRAPWLRIQSVDLWDPLTQSAPSPLPSTLNDAGYFNLRDYLRELEDRGMAVMYFDAVEGVPGASVRFLPRPALELNFDLAGAAFNLISETYSAKVVSKITLHTQNAITNAWSSQDYFLFDDGTYGTSATAGTRVQGEWRHLYGATVDDVAVLFAENEFAHSIKIRSSVHSVRYSEDSAVQIWYLTPVKIRRTNGSIVQSRITGMRYTSNDEQTELICGSLATTLTEMIKKGAI
ncbi:MAG: hypothetical protein Q4C04_04460 [Clostridia bacterium]|nr:hypothetical protein [Clostridia bacterium]